MTGRLDFGSFAAGSVLPPVREGKLKGLAVIQEKRSALAPTIPTITEQGLPQINANVHMMLFGPSTMSNEAIAVFSSELRKIVADPTQKERFMNIAFEPTPLLSAEANDIFRKTGQAWQPIIKRLNILLD
jgi:tripartite-type tricarboxylate transporter receptor subunit TctC